MRPLRGLQEPRVATREESGVLGFPSRRGLTPRVKKGFGGDYGMKMKPNCHHILCEVEWPPMGVGWPPENNMNLKIAPPTWLVSNFPVRPASS